MQFFVLRVASNKEDRVREALARKVKIEGLETVVGRILVPTEHVRSMKDGKRRDTERKLYPGYVFIELELDKNGMIPEKVWFMIKETDGGFDAVVDFAGNEKSMGFAVSTVARGGKIVVSGLMGGNFSLPMVQWIYKRMTIEGFMTGTLAEAHELMALARAGKVKPTPMKEEPMGDVQKWIDELRAGKVVGRIVLKN